MNVHDELKEFFEQTDRRVLGQKIKSKANKHLWDYVVDKTRSLSFQTIQEQIYLAINGDGEQLCEKGNPRKYVAGKGYGFCGSLNKCACMKESLHEANLSAIAARSEEDKQRIKENQKATWRANHGTDNPSKLSEVVEKRKATIIERHGNFDFDKSGIRDVGFAQVIERVKDYVTPKFTREEYEGCFRKNVYNWECVKCGDNVVGHVDYGSIPRCGKCFPHTVSSGETEVGEFIESLGINLIRGERTTIPPLELDIYVPELNLAIEYNGIYWHNDQHKDKKYHVDKYLTCKGKGIHLIQIIEDEWIYKKDIVKSRLSSLLKKSNVVYARKTTVCKISMQDAREFCERHHLGGWAQCTKAYALKYNSKIVAVMTFGVPRYDKTVEWELIRYCSDATVVGGASKLLTAFEKDNNPSSMISYADRNWSNGNLYLSIGFEDVTLDKRNTSLLYFDRDKRIHRSKLQKSKLVEMGHDPNLTAHEIIRGMGYHILHDAGNYKFLKKY